jgi:hypothetical protein
VFVAGNTPGTGDVVAFAQGVFGDAGMDVSGSAKVVVRALPHVYALHPNMPNPFNASTRISYTLPRVGVIRLTVYDLRGGLVCTLMDGLQEAGEYQVVWDGRSGRGEEVSSGVYIVRLEAVEYVKEVTFSQARRITLLR